MLLTNCLVVALREVVLSLFEVCVLRGGVGSPLLVFHWMVAGMFVLVLPMCWPRMVAKTSSSAEGGSSSSGVALPTLSNSSSSNSIILKFSLFLYGKHGFQKSNLYTMLRHFWCDYSPMPKILLTVLVFFL